MLKIISMLKAKSMLNIDLSVLQLSLSEVLYILESKAEIIPKPKHLYY